METPVLSAAKLDMGSERGKSGDGDIHITVPGDGERAISPRCEARHRRAGPFDVEIVSVREVFRVHSSERPHSEMRKPRTVPGLLCARLKEISNGRRPVRHNHQSGS